MANDNLNHNSVDLAKVSLGATMPDSSLIPVLTQTAVSLSHSSSVHRNMIQSGLTFAGNVTAQGIFTIAGHLIGNLHEKTDAELQVVISDFCK